ncbi:J domain-containing protein [Thermodesulfovibrionales bacterium]|nr:J domain-containing protein [Thermodesulfovibrionales bacterium]
MMSSQPDYYAILQVHPEAEIEVIIAAYRRLAAKYHPDVNKTTDAAEMMKQINAAYEVLSDPIERAKYDAARNAKVAVYMSRTPQHTHPRSRQRSWFKLLAIPAGLSILAIAAAKFGLRVALLLGVFLAILWVIFALVKPRR